MSLPRVLSRFLPHPRVNFMQMCVHPSKNSTSAQTSFITWQQLCCVQYVHIYSLSGVNSV